MPVTVYVLEALATGKRYVGITGDLERRLAEHRAKQTKGAQILGEFKLIYTGTYPNYEAARAREKFLKSGRGCAWLLTVVGRVRPA